MGPDDDELHLFYRCPTHDFDRRVAGDNEALVHQLRGVGLLHQGGETLVASVIEGFDEGLWRHL